MNVVTKAELIEFLKEELTISIDQYVDYGPTEKIKVTLSLGYDEICVSTCILPGGEGDKW